MKFRRNF